MKLTLPKSTLASALAAVSPACGKALPVLACAKLEVAPNETWLSATDLDCYYQRRLSLKKQPEIIGECLLPISGVKEWLGIVSGDVTIESDGQQVKLSVPDGGYQRFSTDKIENFPAPPTGEEKRLAAVDLAPLKNVSWAAIKSDSGRPMLEAVFIEIEGDGLVAVATDGRKIGRTLIKAEIFEKFEPVSLLSEYADLVAGLGKCEFSQTERSLIFTTPSLRLMVGKSTEGVPNWRRDIASPTYIGSMTVIRSEMEMAIKQCHLNRGQDEGILVEFHQVEGGIRVFCVNEKSNNGYDTILTARIKGEFKPVGFGTEHLMPFFDLPDDSALKIEVSDGAASHWNAGDTEFFICSRRIRS